MTDHPAPADHRNFIRGVVNGLLLSCAFWAVLGAAVVAALALRGIIR